MTGFAPDSALVKVVRASPNHGERADNKAPDSIILHYTGMATEEAALDRLCDPAAEVSCHYAIRADGEIVQLVPEGRRAWHAGKSYWTGDRDMNSVSIGIELMNGGHDFDLPAYPEAQIAALIALCRDVGSRHAILPSRVLAHSDIAPFRKRDPGEHFPWRQLAEAGVGHYVSPLPPGDGAPLKRGSSGEAVEGLQGMLAIYGYDISVTGLYGKKTEVIVAAFQRHFRPSLVDGKADRSTIGTLRELMATRPREKSAQSDAGHRLVTSVR
ncbi:N-acetylmuramoyl-L-alanine amidase [Methylovirgula sp. HY1]|uniref:peptidoglycan recognition protein family protein n=1 Tax=Methylovirgula sp. HY1 TaxID=2822761 RepID=UPI001C5B5639|nr:N-acetylmuramoyl-L-alanine amidase [Methylovirgula sp. HY1]QXX76364.1 N-acetylmuramoyl-L-alanine amidase AmiD [Methylovirgula sp. HY1]